jgi:hypothetical protein
MAADHPFRWIGGAALVVGLFVLGATSFQEQPQALALPLERTTVSYAQTRAEAVAKASMPVTATKVASRPVVPRKVSERIAQLPIAPDSCMTITALDGISGMSAPSSGGDELTRALKAAARAATSADAVPTRDTRTIHGNQVAQLPPSVVLLAARPVRGPPRARGLLPAT